MEKPKQCESFLLVIPVLPLKEEKYVEILENCFLPHVCLEVET